MINKYYKKFVALGFILFTALSACSGTASNNASPAAVVESYLKALVAKDDKSLSILSCSDFEADALMELDSFQAVEVRLDGLACSAVGTSGEFSLVNCQGNIVATYNGEDQNIDLSARNYQVIDQKGEFLVCGYQ
ncbi:MAG: hypothetical protein ABIJ65_00275 [Chloroflexota bacterium]